MLAKYGVQQTFWTKKDDVDAIDNYCIEHGLIRSRFLDKLVLEFIDKYPEMQPFSVAKSDEVIQTFNTHQIKKIKQYCRKNDVTFKHFYNTVIKEFLDTNKQ